MEEIKPKEELTPVQKKKKILKLLTILIAFNLLVFGIIYASLQQGSTRVNNNLDTSSKAIPSVSPFPFQEMTIPYLRSRQYDSSLGQLNQATESQNYTGYLANYDSEGFRVNGYLTMPKGQMPAGGWPAIVFLHGYIPPQNYNTLESYSAYVDYLARNGLVVFKIDLRGHAQSEGEPGGGYFSGDYIIDTLNAKAALADSDFVNPDRIGFWGHSMAGNVVSRAMAASPDTKAVAIWAGAVYTYSDMQELGIDDNSYQPPASSSPSRQRRNQLFEKYGEFNPNSEFWKQVPMTNYLADIEGAISLSHAKDDAVVTIDYSRNLARLLSEAGVSYELNEYDGGGHNLTGSYLSEAMGRTVEFFKNNL